MNIASKTRNGLRIAFVSDIHLGHANNSASEIIKNLQIAFPDNSETGELDMIVLVGDVFDGLLYLTDDDVWAIKYWVTSFLRLCKKHDIVLRVLKGTPSHDWEQSEIFANTNSIAEIGTDIKYVKVLSIEYIERFGITALYVPDEVNPSTEKTLSQVHELLQAKGLDQVDYAFMHGQFEYQLPDFVAAPKHDSAAYLRIVKYLISIGHVHTFSRFERIIAQGSFDRLSHGQEEPKGHVRAFVRGVDDYDVVFVENEGAKRFVTVNCLGMSIDDTIKEVDNVVTDLPAGSYTRIRVNHDNPILESMDILIRRHPLFTWGKIVENNTETNENERIVEETIFEPITITRDNIEELLIERMAHQCTSAEVLNAAELILRELK
jgi:UDP-2,3-diacylglucosamine pyrophosphatase LpxH